MTPGRDQWGRVQTLAGCVLVALAAGTNYVYSAYAPQMGKRLNLSHTQLNIIGIAGNVGVYCFAPISGWVVDRRGPKLPLYVASALLFFGYGGIRFLFTNAYPAPGNDGGWLVFVLALCSLATGIAGSAGVISAMNAAVRAFPARLQASMTGTVNSAFGLSAFFFSMIARELFPGKTESFLTVLVVGTTLPVLLGAFAIKPDLGNIALVGGAALDEQLEQAAEEQGEIPPPFERDEETPLRSGEESVLYGERNPWASQAPTPATTPGSSAMKQLGEEDVHGLGLVRVLDFWMIFAIVGALGGPGLMYINNVGSIVQALFAVDGGEWDETVAAAAQANQVSILSVCSFFGRLLVGFLADYISHSHTVPRTSCLILSSLFGIVAQAMLTRVETVGALWKVSMVLGLSYGTTFALFPALVLERFGITHFAQNAGLMGIAAALFGNVFNYGFGRNFDAHSGVPPNSVGLAGNLQCYIGRRCYVDSIGTQPASVVEKLEAGKGGDCFELGLGILDEGVFSVCTADGEKVEFNKYAVESRWDCRKPPMYVASMFLLLGYGGIRFLFTHAQPAPPNDGAGLVFALALCLLATGTASSVGVVSAVNAAVKVFPSKMRASVIGVVNSTYGLSAFFFSLIAREFFPGETGSLLTVLVVGTSVPVLVGASIIRPKAGSLAAVEVVRCQQNEEENETTPLWSGEEEAAYGRGVEREVECPTSEDAVLKDSTGCTEDLHGLGLFRSTDFWIIFGIIAMLGAPGLMYINNVGSIVQALSAANGDGWDEKAAAATQASQVSIISICSSFGRLLIGFLADYLSHSHNIPRATCFILCSVLGISAQAMLIQVDSADGLWKVSIALGLSFGTTFALYPALVSELFDIAHFSQNCGMMIVPAVLLGNAFNYGFGRNYDAHSGVPPDLIETSGHLQCYIGRMCYINSIYVALGSSVLALALSFLATRRSWKRSGGYVSLN
ncbi:MFS general substrate transporter [Ceratobasidium sp. AG-I]|nr:MFS general substrate transporter [Ceratobasidium sp. AG-I]